ncbi:MAG: DsbA family protein [Candidatus Binataceae bacterium]
MRYRAVLNATAAGLMLLLMLLTSVGAWPAGVTAPARPDRISGAGIRKWNQGGVLLADDWAQVPSNSKSSTGNSAGVQVLTSDAGGTSAGHPQRGPDGAPVTITEYSDFQCPYCRQAEGVLKQVLGKYGDRVRLVYMDFPLSFHHYAMGAAIAARCAQEQGKFWEYHDAIFSGSGDLSASGLEALAAQLDLYTRTFNTCLDRRQTESTVTADKTEGEQKGVNGTPDFFINSRNAGGITSLAQFNSAIDAALSQSGNR